MTSIPIPIPDNSKLNLTLYRPVEKAEKEKKISKHRTNFLKRAIFRFNKHM
jgi:hypothetical protein